MSAPSGPTNSQSAKTDARAPGDSAPTIISAFDRSPTNHLFGPFGPNSSDSSRGTKRTHADMVAGDSEAATTRGATTEVPEEGPSTKRATGAINDAMLDGHTAPGSVFTLTTEEQAWYEANKHTPSTERPPPQKVAYSLAHFDPDYDYIADPESSPPRALTWWNKAAAKFRPGLSIRDINFDPLLPTDHNGEPIPTKHTRWWLPDGDVVVNIENHLFRLHQRIIAPHLLSLKADFGRLSERPSLWHTEGDERIPLLHLTCTHFVCREKARFLARSEATKSHSWQAGSEEETTLLVKSLAEHDYDEVTKTSKCNCPTPRDFSLVCQMIYSPRTFFNRGVVFFEDLERMLRLSEEYRSLRLRDCAISGLTMLFPTTLNHHRHYTRNNGVRLVPATYAIDTLHLSLQHRIPELLLIAMYTLSNYDHRFLIHGILDPTRNRDWELVEFDSTVSVGSKQIKNVADTRSIPKPMRILDLQPWQLRMKTHQDTLNKTREERLRAAEEHRAPTVSFDPVFELREILARILRGRAYMQAARRNVLFGFLREIPSFPEDLGDMSIPRGAEYDPYGYKFSEGCTSVGKMDIPQLDSISCAAALKALMTELWAQEARHFAKDRSPPKPRHALRALSLRIPEEWEMEAEHWRDVLCPSCLAKFKFEMKRGQQVLWAKLPSFFGMKSWFDIEMESRLFTEEIAKDYLGDSYDQEKGAEGGLFREDTSYLDYDMSARRADVKARAEL